MRTLGKRDSVFFNADGQSWAVENLQTISEECHGEMISFSTLLNVYGGSIEKFFREIPNISILDSESEKKKDMPESVLKALMIEKAKEDAKINPLINPNFNKKVALTTKSSKEDFGKYLKSIRTGECEQCGKQCHIVAKGLCHKCYGEYIENEKADVCAECGEFKPIKA